MRRRRDRPADPWNLISAKPCLWHRLSAGAGIVRRLRREATMMQSRFPIPSPDSARSCAAAHWQAQLARSTRPAQSFGEQIRDSRLFFPAIILARRSASRFCSANLASRYGRGARIDLYVAGGAPLSESGHAFLMVHDGDSGPPDDALLRRSENQVGAKHSFAVRMARSNKEHADVVRFDADDAPVRSVYLPRKMAHTVRLVHLHVMFDEPVIPGERAGKPRD